MTSDPAGSGGAGSPSTGVAASPSGGSGRTTRPSPTRPDKETETDATPGTSPDPNWIDTAGLDGLLGVGGLHLAPTAYAGDSSSDEIEAALPSRDQTSSPSSAVLLGLSLLILLALAAGVALRWWDRRPGRYWPA